MIHFDASDISDLCNILELVYEVVDWMTLGLKLGVKYSTLEKIEDEQRGCDRSKRKMLAAWLRGDDIEEQTWSTLVDALKRMDKKDLAGKIEQKFYNI